METRDNTAIANPLSPLENLSGSPVLPHITANTDVEAVAAWLAEYQDSPQTWKCYRREAERLLLWLKAQNLTLGQVNRDVLRHFENFLADPQPSAQWAGPTKPRHHPQWRPFRGGLSPASRRQSLIILQGLFSWLVEAGWVRHNPFRLMRDKSRRLNNQAPRIERYLERELWGWFWQWLNQPAGKGERDRYEMARRRFIFGFAYLLAPRVSEMADARMGDFHQSEGRWWWSVVGKGNKVAHIPLPADMLECLAEWRQTLGLATTPPHHDDTPVLRALDKKRGIGHNQLYRLIRETFNEAANALEAAEGSPANIAALRRATPHWLRHTSITHQAQAGISLRHLADSARHSRLDTTARYLHNEAIEWHQQQQRHQIEPRVTQDDAETL
ncbi:site-specific integrase [Halomonas janggokensis]|uniref:Site-specific integrase n=1 Tax=Vreelandella janggokensis TaxID=370767 RepID=A0ABT4IT72_9GAMM|nr:site-specific integrase [Halomonas janggokensis]MCZ0926386.1 site-specific integrase [Halomonas janggokensis]MCZ0928924.1 site-specific integrase [Halomonas janggokensis]